MAYVGIGEVKVGRGGGRGGGRSRQGGGQGWIQDFLKGKANGSHMATARGRPSHTLRGRRYSRKDIGLKYLSFYYQRHTFCWNLCYISEDTKAIYSKHPKKDTPDQWLGQLFN